MSLEITKLIFNQAEELRFAALALDDPEVTQEKILQLMIGKTARYTVMWPLRFAAIVAEVTPQINSLLQIYGQATGIVFQLSDDRLGLFGDINLTGKDVDSDAKTGKKTLYALFAKQMLIGEAAIKFKQYYGKTDLSQDELKQIQEILINYGVVAQVEKITSAYVVQAKQALTELSDRAALQNLLSETVEFLANRKR